MAKRGRPRSPGLLTPREEEVLDFIRAGWTNPQIAERLDISVETVKQHVSQVLAKLGVPTREEAAAWQPHPVRPRWQRLLLPLGATTIVAAVVLGLAVLAWGVSENDGREGSSQLSLEDVYARLSEYLSSQAGVLHVTIERSSDTGETVTEKWLSPHEDLGRTETIGESGWDTSGVIADGYVYQHTPEGISVDELQPCHGGSILAVQILGCWDPEVIGFPGTIDVQVRTDEYAGETVIALQVSGTFIENDEETESVTTYLSPSTFLPVAQQPHTGELYTYEWVDRSSLPLDLFDPESIGWGSPFDDALEGVEAVPADTEIAWLGEAYDPGNGLPRLRASNSLAYLEESPYVPLLTVDYADDSPVAQRLLHLAVFPASVGRPGDVFTPCWALSETGEQIEPIATETTATGRIELYRCSENHVQALAWIADTVVWIDPRLQDPGYINPFSTVENMRKLALDLELRE